MSCVCRRSLPLFGLLFWALAAVPQAGWAQTAAPERLDISIRPYLLSLKAVQVDLTWPAAVAGAATASWNVAPEGAANALLSATLPVDAARRSAIVWVDSQRLSPGRYRFEAQVKSRDGLVLADGRRTLTVASPPEWWRTAAVEPPAALTAGWPPLVAQTTVDDSQNLTSLTIDLAPGTLRFDGSPLPSQMVRPNPAGSGQISLLAAPAVLRLKVMGRPVTVEQWQLRLVEQTETEVAIEGTTKVDGVDVCLRTTIAVDRVLRCDLTVRPNGRSISGIAVDLPLAATRAHHAVAGTRPAEPIEVGAGAWRHGFEHQLWVGDTAGGLAWFTDSAASYQNGDQATDRFFALAPRQRDHRALTVNLVDARVLSAETAYACSFGLLTTPSRGAVAPQFAQQTAFNVDEDLVNQPFRCTASATVVLDQDVIDLQTGSLALWTRLDFDPRAGEALLLAVGLGGATELSVHWSNQLRWGEAQPGLVVRVLWDRSREPLYFQVPFPDWQRAEWRHVAINWGDRLGLVVDGRETQSKPLRGLLGRPLQGTPRLQLGGGAQPIRVDELRIFDAPLADFLPEQVHQRRRGLRFSDPLDRLRPGGDGRQTDPPEGPGARLSYLATIGEGKVGGGLVLGGLTLPGTVLDQLAERHATRLILAPGWAAIQGGATPAGREALQGVAEAAHARGMHLLAPAGSLLSTRFDEWELWQHELAGLNPAPVERPLLDDATGQTFHRIDPTAAPWRDHLVNSLARLYHDELIDGVYLDLGHLAEARPAAIGDGQPEWPIWAARRLLLDLASHARNDQATLFQVVLACEQSLPLPALSLARGMTIGPPPAGVSDAALRLVYSGQAWGLRALLRPSQHELDTVLAMALVHGALPVVEAGGLEQLHRLTGLWQSLGLFSSSEPAWLPYWHEAVPVRADQPGIRVSVLRHETQLVVIAANLTAANLAARLSVDTVALGWSGLLGAQDLLRETRLQVDAGQIPLAVEAGGYRLLHVRAQ